MLRAVAAAAQPQPAEPPQQAEQPQPAAQPLQPATSQIHKLQMCEQCEQEIMAPKHGVTIISAKVLDFGYLHLSPPPEQERMKGEGGEDDEDGEEEEVDDEEVGVGSRVQVVAPRGKYGMQHGDEGCIVGTAGRQDQLWKLDNGRQLEKSHCGRDWLLLPPSALAPEPEPIQTQKDIDSEAEPSAAGDAAKPVLEAVAQSEEEPDGWTESVAWQEVVLRNDSEWPVTVSAAEFIEPSGDYNSYPDSIAPPCCSQPGYPDSIAPPYCSQPGYPDSIAPPYCSQPGGPLSRKMPQPSALLRAIASPHCCQPDGAHSVPGAAEKPVFCVLGDAAAEPTAADCVAAVAAASPGLAGSWPSVLMRPGGGEARVKVAAKQPGRLRSAKVGWLLLHCEVHDEDPLALEISSMMVRQFPTTRACTDCTVSIRNLFDCSDLQRTHGRPAVPSDQVDRVVPVKRFLIGRRAVAVAMGEQRQADLDQLDAEAPPYDTAFP